MQFIYLINSKHQLSVGEKTARTDLPGKFGMERTLRREEEEVEEGIFASMVRTIFNVGRQHEGESRQEQEQERITNAYIINDLIRTIKNVDTRLQGKSRQEQEHIIHAERNGLLAIVQAILAKRVPVVGLFLAWCTTKMASFFGFNPFEWLYFNETDSDNGSNARMADKASSDPDLFNALMKAGELFERKNSSYLNKKSRHVRANVASISEAMELATLIINFCKVLPVLNDQPVLVDENDVKIMLASTIKLILNSANAMQRVRETFSTPIYKPGVYGWVKYKFSSNYDIESSCCTENKFVELDVEVLSFNFPSEAAFRQAVREIESQTYPNQSSLLIVSDKSELPVNLN